MNQRGNLKVAQRMVIVRVCPVLPSDGGVEGKKDCGNFEERVDLLQ
jgi:hypothetical protein